VRCFTGCAGAGPWTTRCHRQEIKWGGGDGELRVYVAGEGD